MSSEALHPSIDSILMPPPPKRLREEGLVRADVEFSMACEHRNAPAVSSMHQSQHASCALDTAGNESILDMRQQGATIGAAALPDTINFVTPPPKTSQTTTSEGENGETTTAYSETDSMQSERSTVIVDSMESEKRRDEDMPVTTTTRFSDIIGHASVKLRIDEMLLPLALPPSLSESILTGVRSLPACLLLYGPPGCGKTQLARAIAGEARAAFISIGPSDVLSKFVGESEASVRSIFRKAYNDAKKMESQCTVLFFDEIDALGHSRGPSDSGGGQSSENDGCSRRVLAELLIQLTKLSSTANDKENDRYASNSSLSGCVLGEHNEKYMAESDDSSLHRENVRVIVVAATNRPEDCDPALLRRFSIRANVDLPAKRDRRKIISKFLCEFDHTITKAQLNDLAGATDGWSGCDLESLTREAAMAPIRECLRSAAMLKRRARKLEQQQQGGDESAQGVKQKPLDADEQARAALMKDFRQLRPVTLADFEDAVEFWLGHQHQGTSSPLSGSMQPKRKQVHYDSESSSEDEQD